MALAWYNEPDPYAAEWLRNLIDAGEIAPGVVDTRSIEDVTPGDLDGYTQCHFFAGIGVWSLALRRAGWRDEWPIWTGSCPCQPFSQAGKGDGFDDERHLWPHWLWLISQQKPAILAGEQVASKDAEPWLDLVCADLEAMGFAFGSIAFPSAGVGAPHIRDRTYWVGHADLARLEEWFKRFDQQYPPQGWEAAQRLAGLPGVAGGLADTDMRLGSRPDETVRPGRSAFDGGSAPDGMANAHEWGLGSPRQARRDDDQQNAESHSPAGRVADATGEQRERWPGDSGHAGGRQEPGSGSARHGTDRFAGATHGLWRDVDWLFCRDAKWRPVRPGSFPLADGAPGRVGQLRAYGNALNAEAAKTWIECTILTLAELGQ